ncbi:MAG TPA: F0F1 ATP synthase subunit B [Gammaproteobacteria bacterium]
MNINATIIGQTIAMIFFVWFCMKYIWPFIMEAIEARQTEIADGLAAAEKGQSSLADAQAQVDKLVTEARDQAKGIMDQAHSRANEIVEAARREGEAEKAKRLDGARAEIDVEINRARDELRAQVAAIAVAGAEKVLAREIDADTHKDLLDGLAAEL